MQQVLLNLLSNSVKFTKEKGKILITVEYQRKSAQAESNFLRISVMDSGLGIKEQDKGKLFRLFGSIKHEKRNINPQGIGLGLVISKLIVNKFNGIIDFISKYNKGSTFFFTFELEDFPYNDAHEARKKQERESKNVSEILDGEDLRILADAPEIGKGQDSKECGLREVLNAYDSI
mmetsp:Transcript_42655/g.65430  ORF Transcript_42655/g.65430 Transcript_42655/m.65430 type:complete len:176 (-) Transcript_42655:486-1013(-)